jgi:hypothetical protein
MSRIPISGGLETIVDYRVFLDQSMHTWRRNNAGYVIRSEYQSIGTPRTIYLHRLVAGVTDPKVQVRHIDNDKLNNQRSNLEVVG